MHPGKTPVCIEQLTMTETGSEMLKIVDFKIVTGILSTPELMLSFLLVTILTISEASVKNNANVFRDEFFM